MWPYSTRLVADASDVTFPTGVICAVQRWRKDRVQAECLSRQRHRHVSSSSHPLQRRKHQDRFTSHHMTQWRRQSASRLVVFLTQFVSVQQEWLSNTLMRRPFLLKMEWGGMSPGWSWQSLTDALRTKWRRMLPSCSTQVTRIKHAKWSKIYYSVKGNKILDFCWFVFWLFMCPVFRLQCFCHRCCWCGFRGVAGDRQQTQRKTRLCCGRLWCFRHHQRKPDHLHLWNCNIK